tara:strand:+ start:192 stop:863 length:672 start_codon:yes stop_codon:yes gene_type:complete
MDKLTLVIPAKKEKESLPKVLKELEKYNLKIIVVLEKNDVETIDSIKNFSINIIYQKDKGYGDAILLGIQNVQTKYFCIFNADGSFNPVELKQMYYQLENEDKDIIFASRYEKNCSSEDDTIITLIGNYIFTKLGRIFFNLKITDILYTFVMGNTEKVKDINLKSKNFILCIELPIKSSRNKLKISTSKSNERARIGGKKKVNAFKDGLSILIGMIKLYFILK